MHGVQSRCAAPFLFLCAATMPACHAESRAFPGAVDALPPRQLIIKFKPDSIQCKAADIDKFSVTTGTKIKFVRPVSGDACLVSQSAVATRGASSELEMLKNHPAIEWVELDSPVKAQ
jgi:hypothetical protein